MKRSEMINIMMESYCKEIPYHDDGGIQLMWKIDRLLKDMESAGMLCPIVGDGPIPKNEILNMLEDLGLSSEWETEDEEK